MSIVGAGWGSSVAMFRLVLDMFCTGQLLSDLMAGMGEWWQAVRVSCNRSRIS